MTDTIQEAEFVDDDAWDDGEYLVQRMEWVHAAQKRDIFKDYSNARDANDDSECEKFERRNSYIATLYDEEGPCQYTEHQQYLRLIVFWLRCVQDDKTYGAFCNAIRLGPDSDDVKKLAAPGSFIYEFYNDWGDVRGVEDHLAWIKANSHLFMPAWIEALEPGSIVPSGVMAVTVPNGLPKHEYIDSVFWSLRDHRKAAGSKPKYQIEKVRGESYADTAQRLHVSCYVFGQFDFDKDSSRVVTKKYVDEWELFQGMQGMEFEQVPADELEDEVENTRKTISRWKETYFLCTTKAIAKTFPPKHTDTKA